MSMDIAALVISGVAALGALLSWLASGRSAKAAEDSARQATNVAQIERARHHEEEQPDWDVSGSETSNDIVEFTVMIRGPGERYNVTVEVIEGSVVPAVRNTASEAVSRKTLELGELPIGVKTHFFGNAMEGTEGEQRFLATFRSKEAEWSLYRECDISWAPRIYGI